MDKNVTRKVPTLEQLEYEELTKKMRFTTAKLRIAQEGVDVSSISQQNMDKIMRVFDDMEHIQRDNQQKTSKIQQDANIQTQKVNQEIGKKFGDVQKRYQDLIKSLKEGHPQEQLPEQIAQEVVIQPVVEEVREKTHEEKVSEITDVVLRAMRDSVYKRVEEIMKTVDIRAEATIGRGANTSEVEEELVDHTKQTTVESAMISQEERPDDKDVPTVTPEMMKKTEEEIIKRREHIDVGKNGIIE